MQCRFASSILLLASLVGTACSRHQAPVPEPPVGGDGGAQATHYTAPDGLEAGGVCALDAVDGMQPAAARLQANRTVVFAGWLGDAGGGVPEQAHLVLAGAAGQFQFVMHAGDHRPDVAAALGSPGLERAGYNTLVNLVNVPVGTYRTSIVMQEGAPLECTLNATISIE